MTSLIPLQDAVFHMNGHRTAKELKGEVEKDDDGKIKAAKRTKKYFQMLTKSSVIRLYKSIQSWFWIVSIFSWWISLIIHGNLIKQIYSIGNLIKQI